MKLLLDTHVLLWSVNADGLSPQACELIGNSDNLVLVSMISLWEIRIKESLKKLFVPAHFYSDLTEKGYEILNLSLKHIEALGSLPIHHRDPFDRMLVAQAKAEDLTLVTHDGEIAKYDVKIIKARSP